MGYFRNPEIRKECLLWCGAILLAAGAGGVIAGRYGILLCSSTAVVFTVIHFVSSALRYRRIAALANEVQHFLHGLEYVDIGGEREGELAILRSETQKMMNKLNHQAALLAKDKRYL